MSEVRVVSWNMAFRDLEAAKRQGDLLRKLAPDLMLLQGAQSRFVDGPQGGRWRRLDYQGDRSAYPGTARRTRSAARCRHRRQRVASRPFVAARRDSAIGADTDH
jgi:hypothetical protein